jgi:NAD(P)-dependent dehydrogenase (short-subunit alcohol dehydrogenase family)
MIDRIVLITGALSGIGRAAALVYARLGATVVVSGRRDDAGKELLNQLRELGSSAEYVRVDVRKDDDVRELVDRTVERFGRLDVAVNAAGTEGEPGPIVDQTADTFHASST